MKLFHYPLCTALAGLISLSALTAQNLTPVVAYDVSSVKPHDPGDRGMSWRSDDDGFRAVNVDLRSVIAGAWDLRSDQVTAEPAWADDSRWDVTGKSTELALEQLKKLTPEQRNQMMQGLLAERFHLIAHLETRTGPVFTLVPAKGGLKLKPIATTAEEKATGKVQGTHMRVMGGDAVVMEGVKVPLSMLIRNLAGNLHRTVIDNTGLPADAVYSFKLRWARDTGTGPATETDALPIPAALEDQLGLHLEAFRGPVQVLVVDHVEKPAAN